MTPKRELKVWIFSAALMAAIYIGVNLLVDVIYMKNIPAQTEWVEVVDKRIVGPKSKHPKYYVTFEFSDGSLREFAAGRPKKSQYYKAINIGDTGRLSYKETDRNTRFEMFEKDSKYGGVIIEPYRQDDIDEKSRARLACIVVVPVFALLFRLIAKMSLVEKSPEQCEKVQVVKKQTWENSNDKYITFYVTFKFPDNTEKEIRTGMDVKLKGDWVGNCGNIFDSMNEGDTGRLTYKESEEVLERIKNPNNHFRAREFVKFEKDKQ